MTSVRQDLAMLCDYVICRHGTTQPGTFTVTLERDATRSSSSKKMFLRKWKFSATQPDRSYAPNPRANHQSAAESFGPEARVWLFGSRVDDRKLGGDVDLLVESDASIDNPAFLAAQLSARLQRKMHGRKVDVLLLAPNLRHLPIHDIALGEGVQL